jgi:hypothetical protein
MRLPALATLTTLFGAVVLAAWGALGIVGMRGTTLTIDAAEVEEAEPQNLLASTAKVAPGSMLVTRRDIYDASLFSPHVTYMPRPARTAVPSPELAPAAEPPIAAAAEPEQPPIARRVVTASIQPETAYSLASASTASVPAVREARVAPVAAPAPAPKPPEQAFSVGQIAKIKQSLHLTAEQEQYWQPVEAELREIGRRLPPMAPGQKLKVNISAAAAQRLYWAAGPFLMSLREDQKQQVRRLAKSLGLEQVASLI